MARCQPHDLVTLAEQKWVRTDNQSRLSARQRSRRLCRVWLSALAFRTLICSPRERAAACTSRISSKAGA